MTSCAEEWRDIPGFEARYQVSDKGRVRNKERTHLPGAGLLTPDINCNGYHIIKLQYHGKVLRTGVHRLVAMTFIPNPHNKAQVNHINGDKSDNSVASLEWTTCQENNLHRCRVLHCGGGRPPRAVVNLDTGQWYPSITVASKSTGALLEKIVAVCKGKRKTAGGIRWAYAEEVGL